MTGVHFKTWRCVLEPLTPIHVGSGEVLDPFEYCVETTKETNEGFLCGIDLALLLTKLTDDGRAELVRSGNRDDLTTRNSLQQRALRHRAFSFRIPLSNPARDELLQTMGQSGNVSVSARGGAYGNRSMSKRPARQSEVHMFSRQTTPYLPGSSVKGVLRTCLVEAFAANHESRQEAIQLAQTEASSRSSARFEAAVMGSTKDAWPRARPNPDLLRDPLRQILVTDLFPDRPNCTRVVQVKLVKRSGQQGAELDGVLLFREVSGSIVTGDPVRFSGEFRWNEALTRKKRDNRLVLPSAIGTKRLLDTCHAHYRQRLIAEIDAWHPQGSDRLLDRANSVSGLQSLIRIGRHSHFECTTVSDPFRQSPPRGYGKSRTYIDGRIAMGWAILTLLPT